MVQSREGTRRSRARVDGATPKDADGHVLDAVGGAIIATDTQGIITHWNRAAEALYGARARDVLGRSIVDVAVPDVTREEAGRIFRRVVHGETWSGELLARHGDGTQFTLQVTGSPVLDEAGNIVGAVSLSQDITERVRAKAELTRRERMLAEAQALAHVGSWETDLERGRTVWSDELRTIWGLSPDQQALSDEELLARTLPDDRDLTRHARQMCEAGRSHEYQFRLTRSDGSQRTVLSRFTTHVDETGRPARVSGTVLDITGLKEAENAARRYREQVERILRTSPVAIGIGTVEGRILDINERYAEFFGYRREEMIGRTVGELGLWEDPSRRTDALRPLETSGSVENVEAIFRTKSGELRDGILSAVRAESHTGDPLMIAMVRDVSAQKRLERELELRRRQQEAVAQLGLTALKAAGTDGLLDAAVALVSSVLSVEFAKVLELLPGGDALLLRAGVGLKPGLVGIARVSAQRDSQAGFTLLSMIPVVVDDLRLETRFRVSPLLLDHAAVSGVSVAIPGRTGPWGVLAAHTRTLRQFSVHDEAVMQSVANILGAVLERERGRAERQELLESERRARERQEALSRRLLEVQEQTARHLARELHDEIGQMLTGLLLRLESAGAPPAPDVIQIIEDLHQRVHSVSTGFRPPMLDVLGLLPALLWHIDRFSAQTGVKVDFSHAGLDHRFSPTIETTAFRVVQETLTNAARYAGVPTVHVRVSADAGQVSVDVHDLGAGFDVAQALALDSGGLAFMQERVRLAGGSVAISSTAETGTRVTAHIPLTHVSGANA